MDGHHFFHVSVVFEFIVTSLCRNFALLHDDDSVCEVDEINRVSDEDASFVFEKPLEDL